MGSFEGLTKYNHGLFVDLRERIFLVPADHDHVVHLHKENLPQT